MAKNGPTGDCLRLLQAFAGREWSMPAWAMNHLGMLNERGRISDLRQRWGVRIDACSTWVEGRKHTTYTVHPESRLRALFLISAGEELERTAEALRTAMTRTGES